MPQVSISIPTLLQDCTKGQRRLRLEAATAQEALGKLLAEHPLLKFHLLDKEGKIRPHLVVLLEGLPVKPSEADIALSPDQELHIMQAVSGG
ncbi:MAG: MoaD/ThiS family protein [Trueperaceae bacterium]|nr:MoaD/ThiS family protein [Trueperaceae bacterium]